MTRVHLTIAAGLTIAVGWIAASADVHAGALDRIRETGTVKIAYRTDAVPMSYRNEVGEPAGFTVNLCREVATQLKAQLRLAKIGIAYVQVTAENRFDTIAEGRADLLCEATTMTLSRRQKVDFSLPIFIDGASVLMRADGPESFELLAGQKIGVRKGTTTERSLNATLTQAKVSAEVVPIADHRKGLDMLKAGDITAYFGDRIILMFLAAGSTTDPKLKLSPRYLSYETYALALPKDDSEFRLAVDRSLSRIYRAGTVHKIFAGTFGANASPSEVLNALYVINALPD